MFQKIQVVVVYDETTLGVDPWKIAFTTKIYIKENKKKPEKKKNLNKENK